MGEVGCCAAGEEPNLRRAIDLITSIIALSYTIRVFSAKWKMIKDRLEELSAGLEAAGTCHSPTANQPLSDFFQAILQTLGACHELAHRCINISYSGKLLMQSDLDVVLAKLDAHIRRLSAAYAAGVLSNGFAIVVSRPGPGASRDDLRFYVKDLATRMKIGDSAMKRQALIALNQIVLDDDKCAKIVVETDEILGLLPKFLDSPEIEIREESAKVTSVICGFNSYKSLLVGAGIIAPLVRVLEGGSLKGKEYSIASLQKLTENSDNAWSISANGGVTSLLQICCKEKDEKLRSQLISPACGVLKNLAGVEEIKRFIVEEEAIPAFIKLVKANDESTQVSSIEFLQAMACGDESIRKAIVRNGGLREIVLVLDPKSSSSTSYKSKEAALKAVESLSFSSAHSFSLLVSYGFIDQLLHYLQKGDTSLQELAFKVAFKVCGVSEEAKKIMGEAGFMPEFIKFLESRSYEIRQMAAEAISCMIMVPRNRKRLVQEERNIGLILQLIDDPKGMGNLKFLMSTLLAVSSCNTVRRRIQNSGCLKSIEKLAESGMCDAKKIIRKVSSNRFQSMVNRILHFDA